VKERTLFTVIIISLFLVATGFLVATRVDLSWLMPEQASSRAVLVDQLFRVLTGVATVIFLIVEGALLYAVIRFRRKPGDDRDGLPIHGNNTLEIVWTIIPAIIVAVIGIYSYQVLVRVEEKPESPLVVRVIGQQFAWSFEYPEAGIQSSVLHLPVNQTVQFQIEARDVIHSFWVPAFRVKHDATPGQIDDLILTPTEIGRYPIRCAELCGAGHAVMISEVFVDSQEDFDAWLASGGTAPISGGQAAEPQSDGAALFVGFGCGACHISNGAGTAGIVGPSLVGIGQAAGTRVEGMDAASYLRTSILAPNDYVSQGYAPGIMPQNFAVQMTDSEVDTLVNFLLTE
jgi:cytochrome c oxidase subunit 2